MQVIVNKLLVNYEQLGNDVANPYLLILPGWLRSSREWFPTAQSLASNFNVIILDFPGFGTSPRSPVDMDTYDYAKLTSDFLNKVGVKKCTVLGHSFGGRVAIILSSTYDLVERLILVDSAGLNTRSLLVRLKYSVFGLGKMFFKVFPPKLVFKLQTWFGSDDYRSAGEMRNTFIKVVNQPLGHLLKDIHVPAFIVWGDRDKQVPISDTKILHSNIKDSLVRVVWGAGHSPHLEKPERFVEIIEEFLCSR